MARPAYQGHRTRRVDWGAQTRSSQAKLKTKYTPPPLEDVVATVQGFFDFVNHVPDYHDLVLALMGSHATANSVQLAGARAAAKESKKIANAKAKNPTGRMASSIRAKARTVGGRIRAVNAAGRTRWVESGVPKRREGARISVNRGGDYSKRAGRAGGVRYGTAVHQGHRGIEGTKFLYEAVDEGAPRAAAVYAMADQWNKVRDRLVVRSKVLEGLFGASAQAELLARQGRAHAALRPGGRAPAAPVRLRRAQLRNAGVISSIATSMNLENEQKAIRELRLSSLSGNVL